MHRAQNYGHESYEVIVYADPKNSTLFYDAPRCRTLDFDIVTEFAKAKERKQSSLKGEHEQTSTSVQG